MKDLSIEFIKIKIGKAFNVSSCISINGSFNDYPKFIAKQLNEKGIAEFNTTIANSLTTTQDSITEVISENNKDITDKLSQKLKVLQTSVITLGLLNLALLAYVAFGAI